MEFQPKKIVGPQIGVHLEGSRISRRERQSACYTENGSALPFSDIRSDELTTYAQTEPEIPTKIPVLEGPVLFAGLVLEQFGHVLMNSLGRLWALEETPPNTKLLFVPKRRQSPAAYPHLRPILESLGINNDFVISRGPLRLPILYTASDIFGERYGGLGSPEFFEWLDRKWADPEPIVAGSSAYFTRSNLGCAVGRYACEDHLERLLVDQGYRVIAPERSSLAEQISFMRTTEKLIFAEGSALHLFAMVRRPEQSAAVILRRERLPQLIAKQLQSRSGPPVKCIQALKNIFWPPVRSDHLSVSLLDFEYLKTELVYSGFIASNARWPSPTDEQELASLNAGLSGNDRMLNRADRAKFLADLRRAKRLKV